MVLLGLSAFLLPTLPMMLFGDDAAEFVVWPLAAVAFAGLWLGGVGLWPGLWAGALGMSLYFGLPLPLALIMATGRTAAFVLAVWGLKKILKGAHPLAGLKPISWFFGMGAIATLGAELAATFGLGVSGLLPDGGPMHAALERWASALLSATCLGGLALAWDKQVAPDWRNRPPKVLVATLLLGAFFSAVTYTGIAPSSQIEDFALFLSLPLQAYCAFRYGALGGMAGVALIWLPGMYGTPLGHGPLAHPMLPSLGAEAGREAMVSFQTGMAMWSLTNLWVSGLAYDRRQTETALKQSLKSFEHLLNSTFEGMLVHQQGRIIMVNNAFLNLCGYKREDVLGLNPLTFLRPVHQQMVLRRLKSRDEGSYEAGILHREGFEVPVEMAAKELLYQGKPARVVTVWDLSRRKRNEETLRQKEDQLRQSQKMEAVGRLAGGIAHDFNNLLVGIQGYAELLHQRVSGEEKLEKSTSAILRCASRAADLTEHLLSFSRKGSQQLMPVDFHGVVDGVAGLLDHCVDRRVTVRLSLLAKETTVLGDPAQLESMLLNLSINASDAMPGGGELSIRTDNVVVEPGAAHDPQALRPGAWLHLCVQDNGLGMTEETRSRCFEPFFTTKDVGEGTGLGLATVYGTVKTHGGDIQLHSEPGKGTTFEIFLPLVTQAAPAAPVATAAMPQGAGRVLVVDDEAHIRELCQEVLTELGYEVLTCADGLAALETFVAHEGRFTTVVMDMVMPGMDGHETLHLMREVNPTLPVLLCTGFSQQKPEELARQDNHMEYLPKPFRLEELAQAMSRLAGKVAR